jgi:molybdopterin molybdotransferase
MVQVEEALQIIANNSCIMPSEKIPLKKSLGFILAEAIYSPIDMPPFRQSAMDGYAFFHVDTKKYEVVSTIQAGDFSNIKIKSNQAIRIFTGAYVPDSVNTVVMQEHTERIDNSLEITKMPAPFANVRQKGEQVENGALVMDRNTLITAASIGFMACLGIKYVTVYAKPKVAIIVTGNELVKPGAKLPIGKIYESNSIMLEAALIQTGITKIKIFHVKDTLLATKKVIKKTLATFDFVMISGGISVGDYDFVKEALLLNGVEELFYKINQKPGKPLFFGKKNKTQVFALPGNPASALTCYYVYAFPAIKKRMGFDAIHLPKIKRKIDCQIENTSGKALFLKSFYNEEKVSVLESQSSAMLNTFTIANALIYLPYDTKKIEKGEELTVLTFNN